MTIAVVTGASRGLGLHIAHELARSGADILIVGRDKAALLHAAHQLKKLGVRVAPVEGDLTEASAIDLVADVAESFGGADILVNNAAIQGPIGPSWSTSEAEFARTINANLIAPAALCRKLIPGMIAKGAGWIVNISGGGATGPRPNFSAYAAAKTALVRYSETLAAESKPFGIRVNAVAPGAFPSNMTSQVLEASDTAGEAELQSASRLLQTGSDAAERAARLVGYLTMGDGRSVSGLLVSAIWDDWATLHQRNDFGDLYTLRRISA